MGRQVRKFHPPVSEPFLFCRYHYFTGRRIHPGFSEPVIFIGIQFIERKKLKSGGGRNAGSNYVYRAAHAGIINLETAVGSLAVGRFYPDVILVAVVTAFKEGPLTRNGEVHILRMR